MTCKQKAAVNIIEAMIKELDDKILLAMPEDTPERTELRFHCMFDLSSQLKSFVFQLTK